VYAYHKDPHNKVNFISTSDNKVVINGLKIDDKFYVVHNKLMDTTIHEERGFARYVMLPSGWRAVFGLPKEHSSIQTILPNERVIEFYRR